MRRLSLKQFMREISFMAPEVFMDEWCDKYFGVKYDEELKPIVGERHE